MVIDYEYDTKQALARDEAIERGLLWLVHDVWLQGPLPKRALVLLVEASDVTRRDSLVRVERALRRGFFRLVKTRAGWLCTLGARGRSALGLDDKELPGSRSLELAFARHVAASVILPGWRAALQEPKPMQQRAGEPESRRRKREKARLDPRHAGQRGSARPYEDRAGERAWLLVGLPDPSAPTVRRLVCERAAGERVIVVSSRRSAVARLVPPGHAWGWESVLQGAHASLREPLADLLEKA